jgi:hypothetical protein
MLKTVAPKQYSSLIATRENRHGQAVMEKFGVRSIAAAILERYGPKVLGGPFEGMEYITESAGSSYIPKLVGSYECELKEALTRILATRYDTVIDVGSAEGYYAVGLAMHLPGDPRVYAYDVSPGAQNLCKELAQKNGVDGKVFVHGFCDAANLQETLKGKSLVICDCEGYEGELLDPEIAPNLAAADVLVELHDHINPSITPNLIKRFSPSHNIVFIATKDRDPSDYPAINFLSPEQQQIAVSEFRNCPQQWAFLNPKVI